MAEEQTLRYEKELREEIDRNREAHRKTPLRDEEEERQDEENPKPQKDSGRGKI